MIFSGSTTRIISSSLNRSSFFLKRHCLPSASSAATATATTTRTMTSDAYKDPPGEGFTTTMLHHGHKLDSDNRARAVPIFQSTSFEFKSAHHGGQLFALAELGPIYSRIMNPTTHVLEYKIAKLEGAPCPGTFEMMMMVVVWRCLFRFCVFCFVVVLVGFLCSTVLLSLYSYSLTHNL